jgi:mono/diheme cytochrome c family protein
MVRGASPSGSSSTTDANVSYANSPEQYHSVGPLFDTSPKTTSLDIIGTRALPEDVQGCAVIGGYFGAVVELHRFHDAGSGFKTTQLPKLVKSSNASFRPVDVSVGPDGAIYLADWFNPVIGHYQASYADPQRDRTHGRIWRVSARGRAPIKQPNLAAMKPPELLEQLRSGERWTRYQAKRLLFDAPAAEVLPAADRFVQELASTPAANAPLWFEMAGVYEGQESPRPAVVKELLSAKDWRVRAYGARVVGQWADRLPDALALLRTAVQDASARVRLEAVVAASYVAKPEAALIVAAAADSPRDPFLDYAMRLSARALQPLWGEAFAAHRLVAGSPAQTEYLRRVLGTPPRKAAPGETIYEMACLPCHQPEGKGLAGVYPPLTSSAWVRGDAARLIRIVLHGLQGPITVNGQEFGGTASAVPMPALGGLADDQIADVLTFVRATFGGGAGAVTPAQVQAVRESHRARENPWTASELSESSARP